MLRMRVYLTRSQLNWALDGDNDPLQLQLMRFAFGACFLASALLPNTIAAQTSATVHSGLVSSAEAAAPVLVGGLGVDATAVGSTADGGVTGMAMP